MFFPTLRRHLPPTRLPGGLCILLLALLATVLPARAQSTFFLDDIRTFSSLNDNFYQNFTITGGSIDYELRFVSDYDATCAIISNSNLQTFLNGGSVPTYAVFNDKFGLDPVTLGPGSYSLVMRNDVNTTNVAHFELDRIIDFSSDSDFYDTYFSRTTTVSPNGGTYWQPFTIQDGFRYWLDGASSGLEIYIIPADQLSNFRAGQSFNYFTEYSDTSPSNTNMPGGYEIKLSAGDYVLAARNPSAIGKALQFDCSRWRVRNGGSGGLESLDLSGKLRWKVKGGSKIKFKVARIANNNTSGVSGSLRVRLLASKTPYTGESINAYELSTLDLDDTLAAQHYFSGIVRKGAYSPPPSGAYYTCFILEEYTGTGWTARDFYTFPSVAYF